MVRALALMAMVVTASLSLGCTTVASPALGILYTDVKWGADTEGSLGSKTGKACAESILGLIATGDASIEAAARAGGIRSIKNVDFHSTHKLIFGEFCTVVSGD